MAGVLGTLAVDVAWTSALTGVITVGAYQVGSSDVVGGTFGQNAFDSLSGVRSVVIERGRSEPFGAMQMGTAEIVLNDTDGTYNPENTASPLYGYLKPLRPIRIRETYNGTTYGLFFGFVEEIVHDSDTYQSRIKAVDFFERLAVCTPTIAATGPTTVGAAIGLVLDARGWTAAAWRALDTGHSIPDFSADGTKAGTQLITDLLAMDRGTFFVDGNGITTYHSINRRYQRQTAVATWTSQQAQTAQPGTTLRRIVNAQTVTRTSGVAQTYTDADSIIDYDRRDGSAISSAYLNTDGQALDLATWVVTAQKDPRPPARQVVMQNVDETRLLQILQREIGDYVTSAVDRAGSTLSGWIEQLRLEIQTSGLHTAAYILGKQTAWFWTVGQSQAGGPDVVGY